MENSYFFLVFQRNERKRAELTLRIRAGVLMNLTELFVVLVEPARFADVGNSSHLKGIRNVFFAIGGTDNDDRDVIGACIRFEEFQHFSAITLRQIKIEKNQIRTGELRLILESIRAENIIEHFLTIRDNIQIAGNLAPPERILCNLQMGEVIFNDENVDARGFQLSLK